MPILIPFQIAVALLGMIGLGTQPAAEPVLRVLILTGQNNHDWRATTPKLKSILESTGRFSVDVTEHPEECDAAAFAKYDVLLSNWNTYGQPTITNWPPATRTAFLDFVRSGKGFVSVHAGSSSFYDWPEYQQIAGGAWKTGQTDHGPQHEFTVNLVANNHPITRGLTDFITTDELWNRTAFQANIDIMATAFSAPEWKGTGDHEPVAFTTRFGEGRTFNLLLGHDAKAMDAKGFKKLLCRGTEWAATGKVSADKE
jgi:type 1 glutamine amidotransferase